MDSYHSLKRLHKYKKGCPTGLYVLYFQAQSRAPFP
jgi:hypothetical protein